MHKEGGRRVWRWGWGGEIRERQSRQRRKEVREEEEEEDAERVDNVAQVEKPTVHAVICNRIRML